MTEITDLVDQTTGNRTISSTVQIQKGFQPKIEIIAIVFGNANPTTRGKNVINISFQWPDANKISKLRSILRSIKNEQMNQYSKFTFLVNGKPEKIGNNYQLIKIKEGHSASEYLSFSLRITVNELYKLAETDKIECKLDEFKFEIYKSIREPFGKIASDIKITEKTHEEKPDLTNQNLNHSLNDETVKPSLNWGPAIGLFILLSMFSIFVFTNFKSTHQQNYSNDSSKQLQACINRGIAYFQEIGSYPTLKTPPHEGDLAENVARERCNRTTTAF